MQYFAYPQISDAGITGMDMHSKLDKYERTKEELNRQQEPQPSTSSSASTPLLAGNASACDERVEDVVDQPISIEALRRGLENHSMPVRHPYLVSLRSKAEEDIVNDAKRKKIMLEMCDQTINKEEINRSQYSIRRLKGLRSLNLSSCNRITDVSLRFAFEFLELQSLSLSKCQQVSSIGIDAILSTCPSLEDINLSECHNINDRAIEAITRKLPRLTHLHIERCSQLTDHTLDNIALNCKRLKYLDVRGCRSMSPEPNLRLEHMRSLKRILMSKPGPYLPSFYENMTKVPKAPPIPPSF